MMNDTEPRTDTAGLPDPAARGDLAARLAFSVGRLNRRIRAASVLTPGQISALSTIVTSGPIRPGDIARAERVAAPTVTRILADLESKGFVQRTADPDDGRSFFVSSTDEGVDAIMQARAERAERVLAVFDELTDDQVERLAAAIEALEAAGEVDLG